MNVVVVYIILSQLSYPSLILVTGDVVNQRLYKTLYQQSAQQHTPRRRHSGAAVSVSELSELSVQFKRDTGLSMVSNMSDDTEHSPKSSLSMRYSSNVNFYARLHAVSPELFKMAVMYL